MLGIKIQACRMEGANKYSGVGRLQIQTLQLFRKYSRQPNPNLWPPFAPYSKDVSISKNTHATSTTAAVAKEACLCVIYLIKIMVYLFKKMKVHILTPEKWSYHCKNNLLQPKNCSEMNSYHSPLVWYLPTYLGNSVNGLQILKFQQWLWSHMLA